MKVLDSSYVADFLRGRDAAREYRAAHPAERFALPAVGYYELSTGALKTGRDPSTLSTTLPWLDRLAFTQEHALEAARVRRELEADGERIQHPDMLLAGVARSIGVPVVTADGDFERVEGLDVENYREASG